jgi:hypothetical protein
VAQRIKPYVLKLTPREMIFLDDGLRALLYHLKKIGLLKDQNQAEIMLIMKKIKEAMDE